MKYHVRLEMCKRSDDRYQEIRSRHYIPNNGAVGQQIHYLIYLERELVGIISGGSAAYAVGCRDRFFGILKDKRQTQLNGIIDNTVFRLEKNLPNLGTQVLKMWRLRVADDWREKYGVSPAGFETFVIENERRKGAMYRADNWTFCGETEGSTKFHQHGVTKEFIRVATEKKMVFCRWIPGGILPTQYYASWNLPRGVIPGQLSLFD